MPIRILCCSQTCALEFAFRHLGASGRDSVRVITTPNDVEGLGNADVHVLPCWADKLALWQADQLKKKLDASNVRLINHDS